MIHKFNKRIEKLEKEILQVDSRKRFNKHKLKQQASYAFFFILIAMTLVGLYFGGVGITGHAIFGESFVENNNFNDSGLFVEESGTRVLETNLTNINSVTISGTIYGDGKAGIYLEKDGKKKLVYYFAGNAEEGVEFSNECSETCYIDDLSSPNNLSFELEGTQVRIDEIRYMYHALIDFEIEPKQIIINHSETLHKNILLEIKNKELEDFALMLYLEGPLNQSMTLHNSWVKFDKETSSKTVRLEIELPENLEQGVYENKVIARYVPRPGYKFKGSTPTETASIVVVNNNEQESVVRTAGSTATVSIVSLLTILFLINYFIYIVKYKKKKDNTNKKKDKN